MPDREIRGSEGEASASEIGRRLTEVRRIAGHSQAELGDILGVSKRAVQTYENGITIPWRHLPALAEIYGRPIGWFLHGHDDGDDEAIIAVGRLLTEELERHDRSVERHVASMRSDLSENNRVLLEIRDSLAELVKTVAPAAAALAVIVAGVDPGSVPGL